MSRRTHDMSVVRRNSGDMDPDARATATATATAWGLVVLLPPLAWLALVSWSDDKASDAMHVA